MGDGAEGAGRDHVDRVRSAWARERPGLDTGALGVIGRLERAMAYAEPDLEGTAAQFGLSRAGLDVLASLRCLGAPYRLPQRRLQAALLRTSGTVSLQLDRLEGAGLVARGPDPEDRRGVLVTLTARGREAVEAALPAQLASAEALLAGLTPGERDTLAGLLRKLLLGFEQGESGVVARGPAGTGTGRAGGGPAPGAAGRRLGLAVAQPHVARRMRRAVGLPDRSGLLVRAVDREGPGAAAGLAAGDLIVGAGAGAPGEGAGGGGAGGELQEVPSVEHLRLVLAGLPAGVPLRLMVLRGVEEREVTLQPFGEVM